MGLNVAIGVAAVDIPLVGSMNTSRSRAGAGGGVRVVNGIGNTN